MVIPVIRKNENKRVTTRDELNKAIYRDRLSELAEDEAQGVIAERPELVKELQQNLLTDIPQQLGEVKTRSIAGYYCPESWYWWW